MFPKRTGRCYWGTDRGTEHGQSVQEPKEGPRTLLRLRVALREDTGALSVIHLQLLIATQGTKCSLRSSSSACFLGRG